MHDTQNLKQRTAKGFFWAALSNGTQQVVMMLIGIVLARRLAVSDYGMVAMLTAFSVIAGNLQESGFTSALCVKREATHADFNAVFWFNLLVSLALYAVLFACAPLIADFNATPQLTLLGRVSFLGFVLSSLGTAQVAWLFRALMVRQKTTSQVLASLVSGAVGLTAAGFGAGCWSLVWMDLAYKGCHTALVWYHSPWRPSFHIDLRPAFAMFGFGSRLLVSNLLTTLNAQLLQTLLGHFYPASQVGQYSQANKWNTMGYSLLTSMVGNVAQPVLAGVNDERERQLRIFRKMLRFTAMLAFPALGGFALIAPEFIPLVIGAKWSTCVPYLQTLCVAGAFIPVCQVYSNLLISKGASGLYLCSTAIFLLCQLAGVLWLSSRGIGPLLYWVTSLQVLWLLVWHGFARRFTQLPLRALLSDLCPFLFTALLALAAGHGLSQFADNDLLRLLVKVATAVAVYAGGMYWLRIDIWQEGVEFVTRKFRRGGGPDD